MQFMIIGEDEDLHPLAGGPILQTQGEVETRLVLSQPWLRDIPMDDQFLELGRLRPEGQEQTEDAKPEQPAWSKVTPPLRPLVSGVRQGSGEEGHQASGYQAKPLRMAWVSCAGSRGP